MTMQTTSTWARQVGGFLAAFAVTGAAVAGCGAESDTADPPASDPSHGHSHDDGHSHGDGAMAGDPSATPADRITDAEVREGTFVHVDDAPQATDGVSGTAWLAGHAGGTTVTIDVSGLKPGMQYMSHLHRQPCSKDNGGPHFKFDPDGSDKPPNEVHLMFSADADGTVRTTIENDNPDSDRVKSIVLHLSDADGTKFACADL